ncbi:hypothetical protein LL936_04240 [Levilactobacillus brevis]|uniref:hypothetical protein n=1 Tax=Levilactobacillus brevis TaxID=1580 RepID=UPI0011429FE1|nr:hypothetical protein [Levilactobacillus brevis]MBU7539279.1 hypothetical protein [Levilactobacillus brevis]MBU7558469.1 hypothetical protein [Levilactobacillus brevis]MBU7565451.1 hypothetical protein [Levilactobacillus brevis]MCE6010037.1 hypothetical protein [Levilactobacillus brevis]MCE6012369.1 hypothetical protein [Levilactobacillus brevis]
MLFKTPKFWASLIFLVNFLALFSDSALISIWFINFIIGIAGLILLGSAVLDEITGKNLRTQEATNMNRRRNR